MRFLLVCILAIVFTTCFFQESKSQNVNTNAKQVYLEFLGAGGVGSLNYDARFGKRENGWGYKVGIGGAGSASLSVSSTAFTIPLGINYLTGENSRHFEFGTGVTPFFSKDSYGKHENWVGLSFIAGYRYVPFEQNGLCFRAGYLQWIMVRPNEVFVPFLYVSLGYRF